MKASALVLGIAFLTSQVYAAEPTLPPVPGQLDPDMKAVLDRLDTLKPKAIDQLSVEEARLQPTLATAAKQLADERPRKDPKPKKPRTVSEDRMYPGKGGMLAARVFVPTQPTKKRRPIILWFHGGGFVLANLDEYDPAPRRLAHTVDAIVIVASYRQAPEFKFPAAHDDAFAAWQWTLENAHSLGGDTDHIAIAGDGVGANLALNVALRARDEKLVQPRHMLLISPMCSGTMDSESYTTHANSRPLGKATMQWYFQHAFTSPADALDPRINIVARDDLAELPPTTIITAEIDPLRSEGVALAELLKKAGVNVSAIEYAGVVHDFFGMAALVADAKAAQERAEKDLKAALE